jgi:hypothetical protein
VYYLWEPVDHSGQPVHPPTVWTHQPNIQPLAMKATDDGNCEVVLAARGFIELVTSLMNQVPVVLPPGVTCKPGFDLRNMFARNNQFALYVSFARFPPVTCY